MKILITGATGMVGGLVLNHCLEDARVSKVVSIGRRKVEIQHAKLEQVVHEDFMNLDPIDAQFINADAAIFCLGAYTGAVPDDVFKQITFDYVKHFADELHEHNPHATFCLLSGSGADQKEKSKVSFAKYKGMAENYVLSKNFPKVYLFRPGYIFPVQKRKEPNFMYTISRSLYPLIRIMGRNASIKSTELAYAMFKATLDGTDKVVLENKDIRYFFN